MTTIVRSGFSNLNPLLPQEGGTGCITLTTNKPIISMNGKMAEGANFPSALYYVDTINGNDSNIGSLFQPFLTLSKAIATQDKTKTIIILSGSQINETITTPINQVISITSNACELIWNGSIKISTGTTVELDNIMGNSTNVPFIYNCGSVMFKNCYFTTNFDNTCALQTIQTIFLDEGGYITDLGNNTLDCIYSNTGTGTPPASAYCMEMISVYKPIQIDIHPKSVYNIRALPYDSIVGAIYQRAYTPPVMANIIAEGLVYNIYDTNDSLSTIWVFNNDGNSKWNISSSKGQVITKGVSNINLGIHNTDNKAYAGSIMHINTSFDYNGQPTDNVKIGNAGPKTTIILTGMFFSNTTTLQQNTTGIIGGTIIYNFINDLGQYFTNYSGFESQAFTDTDTVVVNHSLNSFPLSIQVLDSTNTLVAFKTLQYNSSTQFTLTLNSSISGTVYFKS